MMGCHPWLPLLHSREGRRKGNPQCERPWLLASFSQNPSLHTRPNKGRAPAARSFQEHQRWCGSNARTVARTSRSPSSPATSAAAPRTRSERRPTPFPCSGSFLDRSLAPWWLIDVSVARPQLSCIDCGEFFSQETVQGHTQCISEAVSSSAPLSLCLAQSLL